jgi:hypothetical protein
VWSGRLFATTRRKLAAVVVAGAVVVGTSATVLAGSGSAGVPGGFTSVVVTKTVPAAGGTITGTLNGHAITVTVPPGALTQPLVFSVTWGSPSEIGDAGISGDKAIIAIGISATNPATGSPQLGFFAHPVTITITGPFSSGDSVVSYNVTSAQWSAVSGAAVSASKATFSTTSGVDFAVMGVSSASGAKAVVAAATVPTTPTTAAPVAPAPVAAPTASVVSTGTTEVDTGEPFLFEGIVAGTLVLVGLASLIIILTGRRRSNWA